MLLYARERFETARSYSILHPERIVGDSSIKARTDPAVRLNVYSVVYGVSDPLLAAKVSFGGLHRYVAQQKLDLV